MSLANDCDTSNTSLINMNDVNHNVSNVTPGDLLVTPTQDKSGVKAPEVVTVSQTGGQWHSIALNEMPITGNALNIAINSADIRPNMTSLTTNTRTIAPKPVITPGEAISGNIGSNLDKSQTVIITTGTDSLVNTTITGTKYGINKVIPLSQHHIALVSSPDGTSMFAVPMSSLMTKGNVNIKSSVSSVPMSINQATLKSKPPILPLKIFPLITSTTSSTTPITVPTIPLAKAIAPQPLNTSNSGLTIIPANIPKFVSSNTETLTSTVNTIPAIITTTGTTGTDLKTDSISIDEVTTKNDTNAHSPLPPPLLTQNSTFAMIPITNSVTMNPPTLTPITTTTLTINTNTSSDKVVTKNEIKSVTGIEEMDSVIKIMEWKDGIGVLPGSDLKFRIDEFGHLDMINEIDNKTANGSNGDIPAIISTVITGNVKQEENTVIVVETSAPQESDKTETKETDESESLITCFNCNQKGPANTFIRGGRFCSKSCATIVSTDLKLLTKRNTELAVKSQTDDQKNQIKKSEVTKGRKQVFETNTAYQLDNQTIENEFDNNEDANEEVEDVETNSGDYNENISLNPTFSWRQYLNKTNSIAASIRCFNESQKFPTNKNQFKVGMKLEGIDPQHPSKFCVLSVVEVCGYRIRLHFDGYKELFDYWVNVDNNFIFQAGFCEQTNRKLEPPVGIVAEEFNWHNYLQQTRSVAAPKHLFSTNSYQTVPPNGFRVSMKLEAVDRANTALVCVATIADIIDNWLLIHFDGWDDSYDYWAETTSPFIHPINWCRTKGRSLTPPKDYYRSSERFSWEEYLLETKSQAVSPRMFKTRPSNNFKTGMKLEVADKRNQRLIRVTTITHRQSHCIKIHFDGWDEKFDYWIDDDSPDIHPVNWCHKTGHPLQPPPTSDYPLKKETDGSASCPTPGCLGIGHIRGPKYQYHYSTISCLYTDSRLEYELPDRLGRSGDNSDDIPIDEMNDNGISPSQSPSPSESNSISSIQKSQKLSKTQQLSIGKFRKRKLEVNPSNGVNGPISPNMSTNSESAKQSRPSTPSSITNLSSLQHSIFSMRMSQQQQEAPVCWDRHSKTTLPGIDKTKSKDVLLWSPTKVAEFIDQIPGCECVGQVFQDQLIDGEAFLLLNQNDIVKILGLKLGPAIKIYNSILVIRDNAINEDNV